MKPVSEPTPLTKEQEQPTNEEIIIMLLECSQDDDQMESIYRVRKMLSQAIKQESSRIESLLEQERQKVREEEYKANLEEFFTEWVDWLKSERDRMRPIGWFKKEWLDGIRFECDKTLNEMRFRYPAVKALSQPKKEQDEHI